MPRNKVLDLLKGGDRRGIGRADEVAAVVSGDPRLFQKLIAGLWSEDPVVRMRAADAAEKATRQNPQFLVRYKKELLGLMSESEEPELRWHLAVLAPRLPLDQSERKFVAAKLNSYLEDRSSIVKTFALQGLADLARDDSNLRSTVIEILYKSMKSGTSAMKARSRKLLITLGRP